MEANTEINYEPIDTSEIVLPRWKKLQIKIGRTWRTIEAKTFGGWKGLQPGQYRVVMVQGREDLGFNLYNVRTESDFIQ